jgi:alpha-1,6-mannosyltransferase
VVDAAVWYGARSGGIRTYLDAKAQVAERTRAFEHHLVVPAAREQHDGGRHELPGVRVGRSNGYRLPIDARPLLRTLADIQPDVVLLHDAHWWPATVVGSARALGATVVAVHHGTAAGAAVGKPGPQAAWRWGLSAWQRRLYERVDAVMAVETQPAEGAGVAHIPLRYGVDRAFRPHGGYAPQPHVLYAGRLSPEKGIELLLEAMARTRPGLLLHLVGRGPAERALRRRAQRLGLGDRLEFRPFVEDAQELARAYAEAACVVVPGAHETFGLVALEAAASGATVVASSAVPSVAHADGLIRVFEAGNAQALAQTIARAVTQTPDLLAAARLSARLSWEQAVRAELRDLADLRR